LSNSQQEPCELDIVINIDAHGKVASIVTDSNVSINATVFDHNCDAIEEDITVNWRGERVWAYMLNSYAVPERVKWAKYLNELSLDDLPNHEDKEYAAVFCSSCSVLTVSEVESGSEISKIRIAPDDTLLGKEMETAINTYLDSQ